MKLSIMKRGSRPAWLAAAATVIAGAGLMSGAGVIDAATPGVPAYLQNFPDFAPNVTPQLPGDVDTALKSKLEAAQKFSQVQREFDLYSWQMFLALNWPTYGSGRPAASITDSGPGLAPAWTLWHNSSSIFQTDGAPPQACSAPPAARKLVLRRDLSKPVSRGLRPFSSQAIANADHRQKRFLGVMSAVGELNAGNLGSDIQQAFSGPLIDQNGEFVFYEIMIDPNEVNYLCENKLYNINGQVAFSNAGGKVSMPWGVDSQDKSGSFELKLAWRILKDADIAGGRYHMMQAVVMDQGPTGAPVEREVTVGLVGMHIGHKTASSPQWIWSTFEQVDNIDVDQVAHPNLSPSFFDPNCWLCTVNQEPAKNSAGIYPRVPVQAWRAIQIPKDKQALNRQAQAALARLGPKGSVWQYYQLIDTQWPTVPGSPAAAWNAGLPDAVANKPGGQPTPVFLTNITMETYFQGSHTSPPGPQINRMNQIACNEAEDAPKSGCPGSGPANPPIWTSPLNNGTTPVKPGISTLVFATESCMGCHSSAGIYTSKTTQSGQLTGDFSWLLSQKAQWYGGGAPARPAKGKARSRKRR